MHVLDSGKTGTLVYPDFWGKLNKEFSSFFPNFCHGIKRAPGLSPLLKNQQILAKKMHPFFFFLLIPGVCNMDKNKNRVSG